MVSNRPEKPFSCNERISGFAEEQIGCSDLFVIFFLFRKAEKTYPFRLCVEILNPDTVLMATTEIYPLLLICYQLVGTAFEMLQK
jgi:hypothetical protein